MKLLIWNKAGDKKEFDLKDLKEIDFDSHGVIVTEKNGACKFYKDWTGAIKTN